MFNIFPQTPSDSGLLILMSPRESYDKNQTLNYKLWFERTLSCKINKLKINVLGLLLAKLYDP